MKRLGLFAILTCLASYADERCSACHPREVENYAPSPMARSLRLPGHEPAGSFRHVFSGTTFTIADITQFIERRGIRGQYPVAWVVGSGSHASAFVVRVGDYLFQSPLSWYDKQKVWAMAPGFEQDRLPDFTRPVTAECLLCHTGSVLPVELTINRYRDPIVTSPGISCDRCHGPAEAHLRKPSRANIINPAKLPPEARDSVCEQCHLAGEARISNPGRKVSDFHPGQKLEDVFSTYIFADATPDRPLKVISHVEQLRRSACARSSGGKLWCGTCHNPHLQPTDRKTYFRERCLSCHGTTLAKSHGGPSQDCARCHMPARPARDGGHTAFTDHRIVLRPTSGTESANESLVAWREPDGAFRERNLGLAFVAVGERDGRPALLEQGRQLLSAAQSAFGTDPAVLTSLGVVLLRQRRPDQAATLLEKAVNLQPQAAAYYVNLATALSEAGKNDAAIAHLDHAIELDPSLEVAYRRLVEVYSKAHRQDAIKGVFERYLKFRPQSLSAREAVRQRLDLVPERASH